MRKILIIQPKEIIKNEQMKNIREALDSQIDKGILILNNQLNYEIVEISEEVE